MNALLRPSPSPSPPPPPATSLHRRPSASTLSFRSSAAASTVPPLVVVGSANADIYLTIPRLPHPGETLAAFSTSTLPGGKGANQACCAARLAHPTLFIGQVGDDAHGKLIEHSLSSVGVGINCLARVGTQPTGLGVVMLQPGGENSIVIVGGANMEGWPEEGRKEEVDAVRGAGIVLLQREIPDRVNIEVAKVARSAGVRVILDAGGVEGRIPDELIGLVDIFSPNETELARMTGGSTESFEEISEAVKKCHQMGVKQVLVKLGEKGSALFVEGEQAIRQPIIKAAEVVDTTGAGDTFTAAYAVALVEGRTPKECLKFAAAAASLCVQVKGAIPSMPDRNAVMELLEFL